MTKLTLALAATSALFLAACDDVKGDTGDTGMAGDGGSSEVTEPSSVSVSFGSDSLTVTISEDGPGGYWLGMAETAASDDPWTGEDCYLGYTLTDGTVLSYCHNAGDGGTLTLSYGGDPTDLDDSTETVFSAEQDGRITYYLYSDPTWGGNDMCWVWGNESSYYDALGCNEMYGTWGG